MRLIVSEKANAAKKIAQFLAEGPVKEGKHRSVPHHTFTWVGEECVSVGLKGRVLNPEYPEEYSNWQKVEPSELIDAEILKAVSEKGVANAVKSLAKKADRVVIATDFDREGELIGVEALSLAFEANPRLMDHVERARFSALTKGEVTRAFDNLLEVSRELADAGEARHRPRTVLGARGDAPKRRRAVHGPPRARALQGGSGSPQGLREPHEHRHGDGGEAEVGHPAAPGAVQHDGLSYGGGISGGRPLQGGPY